MTVVAELTQIISLLEAEIPASPRSPRNKKLAVKLERKLAEYFDKLEKSFPYYLLGKLYSEYVEKE